MQQVTLAPAGGSALAYAGGKMQPHFGPATPSGSVYTAWGQAYGANGRYDGDGNAASMSVHRAGLVSGLDAALDETWRVGFAVGASHSKFGVDARASSASIDAYYAALYGAGKFGALALRFGGVYSRNDIDTRRTVVFPGISDMTNASYNGNTAQIFGEAAYRFSFGRTAIEPFAGLAHVAFNSDGFSEAGGPAALTGGGDNTGVTFTNLGLHALTQVALATMPLTAHASLTWRHVADGEATPIASLSFAAGGTPFQVAGIPIARDTAVLDGGLDLAVGRATSLGVAYSGQLADGVAEHAVKGLFRVRF